MARVGLTLSGSQLPTSVSITTKAHLIPSLRDLRHTPAPALVGQEKQAVECNASSVFPKGSKAQTPGASQVPYDTEQGSFLEASLAGRGQLSQSLLSTGLPGPLETLELHRSIGLTQPLRQACHHCLKWAELPPATSLTPQSSPSCQHLCFSPSISQHPGAVLCLGCLQWPFPLSLLCPLLWLPPFLACSLVKR